MDKELYLGIDVGSVSTNIVIINNEYELLHKQYLKTSGSPLKTLRTGLREAGVLFCDEDIKGAGVTGSGRQVTAAATGADIVKNEITAHGTAAVKCVQGVKTVIEIGGQDSKIIFLENECIRDFAMNTVCAAGTGSFLERQAERLGIAIEDFGKIAIKSANPSRIAGRCAVFAESDMIHKQQMGHSLEDILAGVCEAMVRNYLSTLAKNRTLCSPFSFQGGVAANNGIKAAFEKALGTEVIVPLHYEVMGALGAAIIAQKNHLNTNCRTTFKGFNCLENEIFTKNFNCNGCENSCEISCLLENNKNLAYWGDNCGKYQYELA